MRISTQMLQQGALRGLGNTLALLARAQEEAVTGRRVRTVSDDPIDASQIMRMAAHLRDIEQYRRNSAVAGTRLSTEDVVLTTARDLLARARNLALSGATQSPGDPLRQAAITEIRQIREQLISLGNTRVGNEYIFGGTSTAEPPFRADGTYVGDDTVRQAEIDDHVMLDTNHTGGTLFGGALQALEGVLGELQSGTQDSILRRLGDLSTAEQQALSAQTEVGSRLREIEMTGGHLARRAANFSDRCEALRDVDPTEASVKVIAAQTALERAYAVVGRVLSTNILDYLK